LRERGIETKEEMDDFLHPKVENLHSPKLFSEMNKMVERINQVVTSKEQIMIYGDYDADMVTSGKLIHETSIEQDCLVSYYITNLLEERYGLSKIANQILYEDD